jgi:hypothetical protein
VALHAGADLTAYLFEALRAAPSSAHAIVYTPS